MHTDEMQRALSGEHLFEGVPAEAIGELATATALRSYRGGERLFHEGSQFDDLLLLRKGRVQLDMNVLGRGTSPILTLGPGQLVAWSAVLGKGAMTASATALDDTEAYALPGSKLNELCERNPEFGYRFMAQLAGALSRRLVATRLQLLDLFGDEAPSIPMKDEQHG